MKKLLLLVHILLTASLAATGTLAAEQDIKKSAVPALEQGQAAFNNGDYEQAFSLWQTLATQGHSEAQVFVGLAYANGWGVDRDARLAEVWYRKAAENGNPSGQFFLGIYYLSSDESHFSAGLAWLKRAAKNGDTSARGFLEKGYSRGWFTNIPDHEQKNNSPVKSSPIKPEQLAQLFDR